MGNEPLDEVSSFLDTVGESAMADEGTVVLNPPTAALSVKEGKTRGKNPRPITYEAFNLEKVETIPLDMKTFMAVTKVTNQKDLLELLINGYNDAQYSAASDEIGEFINDAWDNETQGQFRLAVRNTSKLSGLSIEEVVTMLKPAVEKGWTAKVAAREAAKNAAPAAEAVTK